MGLTWAIAWAVVGLMIGVASTLLPFLPWWDAFFAIFDAPLPALAIPGFVGGTIFSVVLGVAGRRRRFDQLSTARFAAWGAAGGVLLSLVPATMVLVGLATPADSTSIGRFTASIAPFLTALCSASAAASLALARRAQGGSRDSAAHAHQDVFVEDDVRSIGAGDVPALWTRPAAAERVAEEHRRGD